MPDVLKLRAPVPPRRPLIYSLREIFTPSAPGLRGPSLPQTDIRLWSCYARKTPRAIHETSRIAAASPEVFPCRQYFSNSKNPSKFYASAKLSSLRRVASAPIHPESYRLILDHPPVDINKLIHDTAFFSMTHTAKATKNNMND